MIRKQDIYGSDEREENKKSMEYPARPHTKMTLEKCTRPIRHWWYHVTDDGYNFASMIVGTLAVLCLLAVVVVHLWRGR